MSKFPTKKHETSIDILTNWVSISMALIFALPSLGIFLGIYYGTGNLIIGAVLGFGDARNRAMGESRGRS